MKRSVSLSEWLISRGLTPQEADLWSDFIADALELLDCGHTLLRTSDEWTAFLGGCHNKAKVTEPELTSGLGDRMKRLRNLAPIGSGRDRLNVGYETPTPGDYSHGIRKSKADFRFERKFEAGFSASFVLEAKLLRAPVDLSGRYFGTEGIGCFTERDPPYSEEFAAGMVGYAFSDATEWGARLRASSELQKLAKRYSDVTLQGARAALASDHSRLSRADSVTILHTILDFG